MVKISQMDNKQLKAVHDSYVKKIQSLSAREIEKNRFLYEKLYHKWFILRDVGTQRGLWNFTPSAEELRTIFNEK